MIGRVIQAAMVFLGIAVFLSLGRVSSADRQMKLARYDQRSSTLLTNEKLPEGIRESLREADDLAAQRRIETSRRALNQYQETLRECIKDGDKYAEAVVQRRIGQVHSSLDDFQSALVAFQHGLTIAHSLRNIDLESVLLNEIAQLLIDRGEPDVGLANGLRALSLSEATGNKTGIARARNTIGDARYNLGDLRKSLEDYTSALSLSQELKDEIGQIRALVSFGYAYVDLSQPAKAEEAYQLALAKSRTVGNRYWEARTLRAMGNLQTKLGENQKAIGLFLESLDILDSVHAFYVRGTALAGLGYAYECIGEKETSLDYYNKAITEFQTISHEWAESETRMDAGRVFHSLGKDREALDQYTRALALFRKFQMPRYEAQTLRDMGLVFESSGNADSALRCFNQSLTLTRAGQDQRYEAYTLNYIGRHYHTAGQPAKALSYYTRALPLNRLASDPSGESLTLYNIARAQRDLNKLQEARKQIEAALSIVESLRSKVISQTSRASYFASVRKQFELYADILMRLYISNSDSMFAEKAFEVSERARARSLLESLGEARVSIREGVDPTLLERERTIQRELNNKAELQMQLVASKQTAEAANVADEINNLTTQYDQLEAQIRSQSQRYAGLTQPQPLSLKQIQEQVLTDNTMVLEYMLGDEQSYLWAVTKSEMWAFKLEGRKNIEGAARRFYDLLIAHQPIQGEAFEDGQARALSARKLLPNETENISRLLLAPLADKLQKKQLLIVPDGALHYVPFQVLYSPDSLNSGVNETLLARHEVINQASISTLALVLADSAERQSAIKTVAVFADPVFDSNDSRVRQRTKPNLGELPLTHDAAPMQRALRDVGANNGAGIPRLMASNAEAFAIRAQAPSNSAFLAVGFDANRNTISSQRISQYRVLHIATHGLLDEKHPELSGIVLSMVDKEGKPQNGFLRLHDIYNLKLPIDLVVLSACNTGLGKDISGEGLIGLTRGFMYAGAAGVVASLWKVDDEATAELMKRFYKAMLRDGLHPSAALRQAQLEMASQKRWSAPYYWAGFIIQGQYAQRETLKIESQQDPVALSLLVIVALATAFVIVRRPKATC